MEMALFGKSGKELHEFLSADNKEMDKTVATARDLGLILNNVTNEQIEQTNRKLNDFKMIQESLGKELNEQLFPYLLKFESILLDVVHNLGAVRDGARIAWAALKEGAVGATKEMINQQVAATKKSQDESDLRLLAEMVASKKSGKLKTEDFHQQLTYFMETTNANQAAIDKILFAEDGLQKKKKEQLHIATNDEIKAADDRVKANKKELEEKSRRVLIYWESAAELAQKEAKLEEKLEEDQLAAKKIILEKALNDERLQGKERTKIAEEIKQARLDIELKHAEAVKKMGEDFVSATKGNYDIVENLTDAFSKKVSSKIIDGFVGKNVQTGFSQFGLSVSSILGAVGGQIMNFFDQIKQRERQQFQTYIEQSLEIAHLMGEQMPAALSRAKAAGMTDIQLKEFFDLLQAKRASKDMLGALSLLNEFISKFGDNRSELEKLLGEPATAIPSLQTGGYIQKGGLVNIHEGETVVPKGKSTGGGINININEGAFVANGVNFANEGQKRAIAREMSAYILGYVYGGINAPTGTVRKV
jgi:hypothetical protein